jgi:hypothetical protein
MPESERPFTIRAYESADYEEVVALFTRINRELAPANMRQRFEQYIATAISGELRDLQNIFGEAKRNAFWVVEIDGQIVGMFGIESATRTARSFAACTSIDPIAAAVLLSACCNVPKRERASSVSRSWS